MNTTTASPETDTKSTIDPTDSVPARSQPLFRPLRDRMLAGVASGAAQYLGVDVTIVRIAFVVLTFFGGAGAAAYLAGWLLIPEEGSAQSIASEFIQSLQARSR
jgi:phage shock protein PspC (stress-responsive transcriptional regulator)